MTAPLWNQEALNACLMTGLRRKVILAVEARCKDKLIEFKGCINNSNVPDKAFEMLVSEVTEITFALLGTSPDEWDEQPDRAEKAKEVKLLLKKRRDCKDTLGLCADDVLIIELTCRVRQLSRELKKRCRDELAYENRTKVERPDEAWKQRDLFWTWTIAYRLGQTFSARRRRCFIQCIASPSCTNVGAWMEKLQKPGNQGGCSGQVINFDEEKIQMNAAEPTAPSTWPRCHCCARSTAR